ncbi:MAG: hypothetical protein KME08_18525 [Aphanothece sp. CMT-3BRIN-NPC111]|jgi:hypothetical protein|nr:hypothetical protein [Aphanothece sp. CMT-3BRIN-NPC111]
MIQLSKRLLLIFITILAFTCCQRPQVEPNQTSGSAYSYLATVADQFHSVTIFDAPSGADSNKSRDALNFLLSYKTIASDNAFDIVMQNVAFTYDNAVAALAFIAAKDKQRAKQVVDTFIYAQNHDRFYKDGRIRNAYWGDKKVSRRGNIPLPGWFNLETGRWTEDEYQVSSHTGSVAWAMLALLGYYDTFGGESYLAVAKNMGAWVENNCRDSRGGGGYMAGFSGWEPTPTLLTEKATEHNLDLYAAFERLYLITGDQVWRDRAIHAKNFVISMWDKVDKKFWTGTWPDGVTINKDVIPLDVQAWAILALRDAGKPYWQSLEYAQKYHRVGQGFDYNQDRDGIWYEGTAHMAVAYQLTNQPQNSSILISTIKAAQDSSGGIPAADRDKLTTGFSAAGSQPWFYFHRLHVGATAWFVLAEKKVNPFWLGSN